MYGKKIRNFLKENLAGKSIGYQGTYIEVISAFDSNSWILDRLKDYGYINLYRTKKISTVTTALDEEVNYFIILKKVRFVPFLIRFIFSKRRDC